MTEAFVGDGRRHTDRAAGEDAMGQIHRRDSAEIRTIALETAVKKYAEGCTDCAQSYLTLAREHGASPHELAAAAERATRARPAAIDRRGLFRIAATAVAAGVAGSFLLATPAADASPRTPSPPPGETNDSTPAPIAGYFGVDSFTSPAHATVAGMPLHFYIGELGATQHGIGAFDQHTAAQVTPAFTHGYWGLCGPNAMPSQVTDPGSWGQQQALSAIQAWNTNPVVGGRTLFADIETGFGGWAKSAPADNVALLNGFVQTITQAGFIPGVYLNRSERDLYFPQNYAAPVPFVYWFAGGKYAGTMAGPCQKGDTLQPTYTAWNTGVQSEVFGGMQAVLWQYWLSGMGCGGDFNYSPQSGYSAFMPLPPPTTTTTAGAGATPAPTLVPTAAPTPHS
jgi:hypothetical protein